MARGQYDLAERRATRHAQRPPRLAGVYRMRAHSYEIAGAIDTCSMRNLAPTNLLLLA